MLKKLSTFILGATVASSAFSYQAEVNAGFHLYYEALSAVEGEDNDDVVGGKDEFAVSASGKFYLQDVNTDLGPLQEAAFLSKASSIGLALGMEIEGSAVPYGRFMGFGGNSKTLSTHAVVDNYIFHVTYIDDTLDYVETSGDVEQEHLFLGFGGYMTDLSTIMVSYVKFQDTRQFVDALPFGSTYRTDEGLGVNVKFHIPFDSGQSISTGGNLLWVDTELRAAAVSGKRLALGGFLNYYPNKYWALESSFEAGHFSEENVEIKRRALGLNAKYFFTEGFAMNMKFITVHGGDTISAIEVDDANGLNFALGFMWRF